jgi:hypothetical protein
VEVARPSRDLNFMVREGLPVRVALARGGAGGARFDLAGAAIAVFAITGGVAVAVAGEIAGRGGEPPRELGRHGCAWATDARVAVELAAGAIAATLVVDR